MAMTNRPAPVPQESSQPVPSARETAAAQRQLRRVTGISAILTAVAGTVVGDLYFAYSGNPPQWDVLTRSLLNLVTVGLFIVFVTGLSSILRDADRNYAWLANLVFGAGLIYAAIDLVKISLEVGVVLGVPSGKFDPTTDGPLAHANVLMHGSVTRLVTALLLAAAGYAILRTRALPRWAGRTAYLLAVINLAFVPSLYFGMDPARFYSALGWGNTALTAGLITYWAAAVGIAVMRQAPKKGQVVAAAREVQHELGLVAPVHLAIKTCAAIHEPARPPPLHGKPDQHRRMGIERQVRVVYHVPIIARRLLTLSTTGSALLACGALRLISCDLAAGWCARLAGRPGVMSVHRSGVRSVHRWGGSRGPRYLASRRHQGAL